MFSHFFSFFPLAKTTVPVNTIPENATLSTFDLIKVFQSCPIIYSILLIMSIAAFIIWFYSTLTIRRSNMMPDSFIRETKRLIVAQRFESALKKCYDDKNFTSTIIAAGLSVRKHGPQIMMDIMRSEGKRVSNRLWQRISFLNEIAAVAPMLGLLGTVLGLFFAFYDSNRSTESITALFDGLGIAIGTTVAGLVVAILAMMFQIMLKFQLTRVLTTIENESLSLVSIIELDRK
jgi:biopolymer transport protein ExbB